MSYTAKSIIIDCAGNHDESTGIAIRSIDFYLSSSKITIGLSDISAVYGDYYDGDYLVSNIFFTSLSKTGSDTDTEWYSNESRPRIVCVFDSSITFDEIRINNSHISGSSTEWGVKGVRIYSSSDTITSTTYGAAITNYTKIFNGEFDEHAASDAEDEQILTLYNSANYDYTAKSVVVDIADGHGDETYLGCRSLDFWLDGSKITLAPAEIVTYGNEETGDEITKMFDTSLSKTGSSTNKDWMAEYGTITNVRIIAVFNLGIDFDGIRINNYHAAGTGTDNGVNNVKITISTDTITNDTYNASVSNSEVIFDDVFDEHSASDAEDEQTLALGVTSVSVEPALINVTASLRAVYNDGTYTPETQTAGINITASMTAPKATVPAETAALNVTASISGIKLKTPSIPAAVVSITASASTINEFSTVGTTPVYFFTLTGSADSLSDLEIPISSFQTRMRSGEPTYLSVVIPGVEYASQIAARPNGTLKVDMAYKSGSTILQRQTISEADFDSVRMDEGGTNISTTLSGHKTQTFPGDSITLTGSIYRAVNNGKITHRLSKPNIYLRPGDTVTIDSDVFTAGLVSYFFSTNFQSMEITEAA